MGWVARFSLDTTVASSAEGQLAVELLVSALWDRETTGVFEDEHGRVIAGFETVTAARDAALWLATERVIDATTIAVDPAAVPADWAINTQATVVEAGGPDSPVAVTITAGATFGHGGHPTTAIALNLLLADLRPNAAVLDVGTGSGVLAIAAAKAGAGAVDAIDIDPTAVAVTRDNAAANGVHIEVATATVAEVRKRRTVGFDLIVANVLLATHRELASAISAALSSNGVLVTAGYLLDQSATLETLYASTDLPLSATTSQELDGWAGHRFVHRGASGDRPTGS